MFFGSPLSVASDRTPKYARPPFPLGKKTFCLLSCFAGSRPGPRLGPRFPKVFVPGCTNQLFLVQCEELFVFCCSGFCEGPGTVPKCLTFPFHPAARCFPECASPTSGPLQVLFAKEAAKVVQGAGLCCPWSTRMFRNVIWLSFFCDKLPTPTRPVPQKALTPLFLIHNPFHSGSRSFFLFVAPAAKA